MTDEKNDSGMKVKRILRVELEEPAISVQTSEVEHDSFDFFDEATDAAETDRDLLFTISWKAFETLYESLKAERSNMQALAVAEAGRGMGVKT
jgi:hypothetical protein